MDLKSKTLSCLLPQLGLASPSRYVYVLHDLNTYVALDYNSYAEVVGMPIFFESTGWYYGPPRGGPDDITNVVAGFNFDPESLAACDSINSVEFAGQITLNIDRQLLVQAFTIDPLAVESCVADGLAYDGEFYSGLTRDDIGGLRYLLSTNNINYESLLTGVQGVGTNSFVNAGWHPGVDKITFVLQPSDLVPGTFLALTNEFTDTYITNGNVIQQRLQRVTTEPDFLFSAKNDAFYTGTTNWINNASLNGHTAGGGPGVIQPPVVIAFSKTGSWFYSPSSGSEEAVQDVTSYGERYGSFDGSTNVALAFPVPQTGNISMAIRVELSHVNGGQNFQNFQWSPISPAGTIYNVQTSTNLSAWNTLFQVTNNGTVCTYDNVNANSPARFYRLIQE
jgi:hypothetical protein